MTRTTAAEREIAAHRVDLVIDTRLGIAESHRMQSWEVSTRAGDIAAAYRERTGSHMFRLRVRWVNNPARDGQYLLPAYLRA